MQYTVKEIAFDIFKEKYLAVTLLYCTVQYSVN
jgi:hypothetical protein